MRRHLARLVGASVALASLLAGWIVLYELLRFGWTQ
jgi:hypothetical protein